MTDEHKKYEQQVLKEIELWLQQMLSPSSWWDRTSRQLSFKINAKLPDKYHDWMTSTVKSLIKNTWNGVRFIPKRDVLSNRTLYERDKMALALIQRYQKWASAEGAGTGIGGFKTGWIDFPVLISIKMKCLFEMAHIYGFSTRVQEERLFLLHIFQFAFSSNQQRHKTWLIIQDWPHSKKQCSTSIDSDEGVDWRIFQQEYRDSLDFRKLLQMVPGLGAVVGAWANYGLLRDAGTTAMNIYRHKYLHMNK